MIKKIMLFSLGSAIFLCLPLLTAMADNPKSDLCTFEPPTSCFYVRTNETEGTKWKRTSTEPEAPKHCGTPYKASPKKLSKDINNVELLDYSQMEVLCQYLQLGDASSKNCTIRAIQDRIRPACEGKCYPLNTPTAEYDGGPKVTCSKQFFADGKYGVCTKKAIENFVAWEKVTKTICDTEPVLMIDGDANAEVGVTWDGTVKKKDPGAMYIWENKDEFKEKLVNDPEVNNVTISEKNCLNTKDADKFPKEASLDAKTGIIFPNTADPCTLIPDGVVEEKPILDVISINKNIKITGIKNNYTPPGGGGGNIEKDPNKLSCRDGLLPKYLVGANCEDELKGDARDITYWIQRFSKQITTFIAAVAVLLIAWNAFGLVTAGGDSDQIATNKKALIWVGAGLLLTVFAYVIVKTIISLTFLQ